MIAEEVGRLQRGAADQGAADLLGRAGSPRRSSASPSRRRGSGRCAALRPNTLDQGGADGGVDLLDLVERRRQAGADGPDRLIGDGEGACPQRRGQRAPHLAAHHLEPPGRPRAAPGSRRRRRWAPARRAARPRPWRRRARRSRRSRRGARSGRGSPGAAPASVSISARDVAGEGARRPRRGSPGRRPRPPIRRAARGHPLDQGRRRAERHPRAWRLGAPAPAPAPAPRPARRPAPFIFQLPAISVGRSCSALCEQERSDRRPKPWPARCHACASRSPCSCRAGSTIPAASGAPPPP